MYDRDVSKVLVVDDEKEIRDLLVDALSGSNMCVSAAASGQEALSMATSDRPDFIVTDIGLGDCSGLEVLDRLRSVAGDIPAVVITGSNETKVLSDASRHRPVEMITKPLDIERLRTTIQTELDRRNQSVRLRRRVGKLRRLARQSNQYRKDVQRQLTITCNRLTDAYKELSRQFCEQETLLEFQNHLLSANNDDDVFRAFFKTYVKRSGSVFGVAMVCDENAQFQMVGRFGVPVPDGTNFSMRIAAPMIDAVMTNPACTLIDAEEHSNDFDASVRKYLVGMSVLGIPLSPQEGQLIGLVVLYRKGEQPFTDDDVRLAGLLSAPASLAVQRND